MKIDLFQIVLGVHLLTLREGGAAIMAIAGMLFFREPPSWQRLLGVAFAIVGLFLLRR